MANSSEIMTKISTVRFNPVAIQGIVLNELEAINNGAIRYVNATNPVVSTLEAATMCVGAHMLESEALARRQYPSLAMTSDELYLHMSDVDYIGRWASPSRTRFMLMFLLEDIQKYAVAVGNTDIRKLTIPKNTEITVSDIAFTLQYPIDIRIMPHGGLSIVYDTNVSSPIQTLSSNVLEWFATNPLTTTGARSTDTYIAIYVDAYQFMIKSQTANLNSATAFKKSYSFVDNYYYTRAYIRNNLNEWVEIYTTHSDQVYDPNKPTLSLKVYSNSITVTVPQIYFNNGLITDSLRLDIYTTKGPLDMKLDGFSPSAYSVRWLDRDNDQNGVYSAPFETMGHAVTASVISGGSDALTFSQLRDRVMDNALGAPKTPITPKQLETTLDSMGYELVLDKDSITERVYLASRLLPESDLPDAITQANCAIQTFISNIEDLISQPNTHWNGSNRLILKPTTLFKNVGGVIKMVPDSTVQSMKVMTPEQLVDNLNNNRYLYTPFHYVMDISGYTYNLRPYSFNKPEIRSKYYVADNETLEIEVGISDYGFEYLEDGTGYRLVITTRSNSVFKDLDHANGQVQLQLTYTPPDSTVRAVMVGTDITPVDSEERFYEFIIQTDFDINNNHQLYVKSFHQFDQLPKTLLATLDLDFDLVFVAVDYTNDGLMYSEIDELVQEFELPPHNSFIGISQERINVKIGDFLEGLWHRARSVIGPEEYERYANDVLAFYESDVYERDLAGNIKLVWDPVEEELTANKIHSQGDPIMVSGQQVVKHHAGEIILDSEGKPTLAGGASNRGMVRHSDILMIDGKYYFSTDDATIDYRESLPDYLRTWVLEDIGGIQSRMLEETELYLYPRSTTGNIRVISGENLETQIEAAQSLYVRFFVTAEVYRNTQLRDALEKRTTEIISQQLNNTTIAISQMQTTIHTAIGENIQGVEINGLGGNLKTITVVDRSIKPSIGKKAIVLADQTISVVDDITYEFVKHTA